jgi:hypothetical protein
MSANQSMMTAMAELEQSMTQKLTEMRKILGMAELAPIAPKKSAGRPKKVKAEGAEAAEKRAPNPFASFVSRVNEQLRAAEEGTDKSAKAKAGTVMQFASYLWAKGHDWEPEAILAERATWEPPAVSKQQLEGKSKRSGSVSSGAPSAGEGEPVSEAPKSRKGGKWSEEAKASAAAKRAAKKAAASGAPADAPAEAEEAFEEAEVPAEAEAAAPAPATPAKKAPEPAAPAAPKKAALIKPKAAPPAKKLDLSFYSITHEGTDYFTNDRHDLISADMVWVGRLEGGKIVEAEEPADLADAVMREE